MVFKHRHHIPRPRVLEQLRPHRRVKPLSLEHRNKIFVTKLGQWPIRRHMVLVDLRAFEVHLPRIPLASKRRHGVHTPVKEDPELRVLVPLRRLVRRQRIPVSAEGPSRCDLSHLRQDRAPLPVKLRARRAPRLIHRLRRLGIRAAVRWRSLSLHRNRQQTTEQCHSGETDRDTPACPHRASSLQTLWSSHMHLDL